MEIVVGQTYGGLKVVRIDEAAVSGGKPIKTVAYVSTDRPERVMASSLQDFIRRVS